MHFGSEELWIFVDKCSCKTLPQAFRNLNFMQMTAYCQHQLAILREGQNIGM